MQISTANREAYLALMKQEIIPALGCTEPIAVALAAAKARSLLDTGEAVHSIELQVSRNVLKNAMSVIIPGTTLFGAGYAAALGAVGGDSAKLLEVLADCSQQDVAQARTLVQNGSVVVTLAQSVEPLYISARIEGDSHTATAVICGTHDHFVRLERDGAVLLQADMADPAVPEIPEDFSLCNLFAFVMESPLSSLAIIEEAVTLNSALSAEGLRGNYGLLTGKTMQQRMEQSPHPSLADTAISRTLGAIDARMAGSPLTAMTNSGSGNQGITATVPVWSVACELGVSHEQMIRAVAFSHMTTIYIKKHLDRLSSLCGAIVAAVGAGCAITHLLGGGLDAIERTVINTIATITGMICDGAKASCALKVSTALQTAFSSLYLALDGIKVGGEDGIAGYDAEETIDNLGRLTRQGMRETDRIILEIMLEK